MASRQGRQFAEQCDLILEEHHFELGGRLVIPDVGVEIDRVAESPRGNIIWFEFKGSVRGDRPGLRRTDTLKKAIANGALLRDLPERKPFIVLTSHLPEHGAGVAMLNAAKRLGYLADVICMYDPGEVRRLNTL